MTVARARALFAVAAGILVAGPGCSNHQDPLTIPVCDSVDVNCRCTVPSWTICGHVCADLQYDPGH